MIISSPQEMFAFGKTLAGQYQKILLIGELGAGKTTFSKGFAAGLWIDPEQVQSPTYTYLHSYSRSHLTSGEQWDTSMDSNLLHIDMYRIENPQQLLELWLLEQIQQHNFILIEWPKFITEYSDKSWCSLEIQKSWDQERIIN